MDILSQLDRHRRYPDTGGIIPGRTASLCSNGSAGPKAKIGGLTRNLGGSSAFRIIVESVKPRISQRHTHTLLTHCYKCLLCHILFSIIKGIKYLCVN